MQQAQKCCWCFKFLHMNDVLDIYNGFDYKYKNWIVHKSCNLKIEKNYKHN